MATEYANTLMNIAGISVLKAAAQTAIVFISLTSTTNAKLRIITVLPTVEVNVLNANLIITFTKDYAIQILRDVSHKRILKYVRNVKMAMFLALVSVLLKLLN
jgi:hypothetical protein